MSLPQVELEAYQRQKAEKILRTISLDPLHCINIQLNRLCWDNLKCLMDYYQCSICDLDQKVLADKQGKSRA